MFLHRLPELISTGGRPSIAANFRRICSGLGARIAAVIDYRDDLIFATPQELSGRFDEATNRFMSEVEVQVNDMCLAH